MNTTSGTPVKSARKIPWIPNQKGAWMMLTVPYWTGVAGSGFRWQHLLVFALCISGYSLFFSVENFLKTRRPHSTTRRPSIYIRPVRLWSVATAILGALSLWHCGALIIWGVFCTPPIAGALWQVIRRKNLSLFTRTCEVFTTSLMCAVAWDIGIRTHLQLSALWTGEITYSLFSSHARIDALICTVCFALYFWSTIPYVKSLVREKTSSFYLALSTAAHIAGLICTYVLWVYDYAGMSLPIFWGLLCVRATIVTYIARTLNKPQHRHTNADTTRTSSSGSLHKAGSGVTPTMSPKKLLMGVGITETCISILYAVVLLAA